MDIRPATAADLPGVVMMGERFYETTAYAAFADYERASAYALGELLLASGVLLIAEHEGVPVGMIGLVIAPFAFNHSITSAHEVMWWVADTARSAGIGAALLDAATQACAAKGCRATQMIHLSNSPPQAAMLYQRLGYTHTESSYIRVN